ncbi:MAG TPA: ABC transporter permease [Bryobacteraceae bacterium]|jgi:predicted permease|nr:ABC transporter permease [Bryobacteraceae bacterium]
MAIWHRFLGGLRALMHRTRTEQDMDEELRAFLDASTERRMRAGMPEAQARRAARVEMGSVESVKEEIRGAAWETAIEALWTDVRYSVRILIKAPVFTAVVVFTLALGIGANTAIFSLIDSLLLKTLPVEKPEELAQVYESGLTNPLWEQIRDRQDVFSGAFAWGSDLFNLAQGGIVQNADGFWVSGDLFRTLGLHPAAGRLLTVDDDRRGCAALAVLSYAFWQTHDGGAASAVGSTLSLDGHPFEVIGVAPRGFYGVSVGGKFDVALPLCAAAVLDGPRTRLDRRSSWWLRAAGRVKPGIGPAQLKARLGALSPTIFEAALPQDWDPKSQDNFRKRVLKPAPMATGLSGLREEYEQPLRILMAVVGLVLLIACANIASLLMARAAARGKEMAMRQALGASRLRLMRQLIVECVLLSFAGAAFGLLLARWGDKLLAISLSTVNHQVFFDFALDGRVLAFTAAIATFTGLLFGVAPALLGTRTSLTSAIKANHGGAGGPRTRLRLWIVASQVALSLVLLVAAGLLLRTFRNLATADIGFDPDRVLLVNVNMFTAKVPPADFTGTYRRIADELRALPGVVSSARSQLTPLGDSTWNTIIHSDVPHAVVGEDDLVYFNQVDPAYFATLRTPLLAGRNFTSADSAHAPAVAVINQTLARTFFPAVNPIGHTYRAEGGGRKLDPPVEVVGVVTDAKYETVREGTLPTIFLPLSQGGDLPVESFEVRSALPPSVMVAEIQHAVAAVNREIPIEVHTLSAQVEQSLTRERVLALLSAFFGAVALLLATIGLYGTLTYLVAQRRTEFGIRMALGATSRSILQLVMRDVAMLLSVGIAAGIAMSLATTQLLGALLFGVAARDPLTMAAGGTLMAAVSLTAGLLAARRATRIDPMVALRQD